ncbi:hypothetical protein C8J56DRAFT_999769 [Mycena floridula]|nr:hypothetical protein C8J56DRAFT_999769 [Mycena floridula]
MTLDILRFIDTKGGNAEEIRELQRKRGEPVDVVDKVIDMYQRWVTEDFKTNEMSKKTNVLQKEISARLKAHTAADDIIAQKTELDAQIEIQRKECKYLETLMRETAKRVGNILEDNVPVSNTEDDNITLRTWTPHGETQEPPVREGIIPHHEVLLRIGAIDLERGAKIAGHRGYFLLDEGIDLSQALIAYSFKKIQTPYIMKKQYMEKTAQLSQFDEELYKVASEGDDEKYLIATSEQPISAYHAGEWFDNPGTQLPIKYAGLSACFRREAGKSGKDMWGIYRVHQFEKVEQFAVTAGEEEGQKMFEELINNAEEFYQSLGLRYRVLNIVSGALNLAATKKNDLEAWFPFHTDYKELVSCSNCTDYQSRRLEIRSGIKTRDASKAYVHLLNSTLCATTRAMSCIAENYQTPEGMIIPIVLRPYMEGREFLPFTKDLPQGLIKKPNFA